MTWASKLAEPYRINNGKKFRLKDFDPASTGHFRSKEHAQELLDQGKAELADLQDKLYAQNRWAVLAVRRPSHEARAALAHGGITP